ncbi:MAG: DUF2029 domain-containing protein [Deltaproteobacteria bacterium]|nr:DUF2029 domain-containing protein [Deltaproteobacteria bacterium]
MSASPDSSSQVVSQAGPRGLRGPRPRLLATAFVLLFGLLNVITPARFLGSTGGDFRHYYDAAAEWLVGGSPFSVPGFDYPPLLAYLVGPFALVPLETARVAWFFLSLLCLVLSAWGVWRWLGADWAALVAVGGVWSLAGTVRENLVLGQVNPLLLLLLVGALAGRRRRPVLAAALLGVATALKLWPAFLFLGFLAKGQKRALAVGVLTAGCLILGPLLLGRLFLPPPHLPVSSGYWMGTPAPLNFSLPAVAARLAEPPVDSGNLPASWLSGNVAKGFRLAPKAALASLASCFVVLLAGALGVLRTLRRPRGRGSETNGRGEDFAWVAMIAVCTLAAPISWYHYQLFQFPALALLVATLLRRRAWGGLGVAAVVAAGLTWSQVFAFGLYVEHHGWTAASPIALWTSTSLVAGLNAGLLIWLLAEAQGLKGLRRSSG